MAGGQDSSGASSAERECPHCGDRHPAAYTHCPRTGKALSSGAALFGRVIAGRYRVTGLIGEGGMGAVYVAEHLQLGRKGAIKRLHPELAADAHAVLRFQREARAAAATGHEHIVEVLDLGLAEDGAPYLVMEHLQGQSLAALLRRVGRLSAARACRIVGQALTALDAVHLRAIIHRDLKPDNIFLTRRAGRADYVKLLDFGISKMRGEDGEPLDLTRTGVTLGTPIYMSPEQARGSKALDHRVDLYAVGVILYECIVGQVPFHGENYHQLLQAILAGAPAPMRARAPLLEPALEEIVLRALSKEPALRFSTATEMLEALVPFGANMAATMDAADIALAATAARPVTGALPAVAPAGTLVHPHDPEGAATTSNASPEAPPEARHDSGVVPRTAGPAPWAAGPPRVTPPPRAPRRGTEPEVKGSLVSAALAAFEHGREPAALEALKARFLPETRRRLAGVIMPMAWWPLRLLDELLGIAADAREDQAGSVAADIGRGIAERELPLTHRLFMQTATVGTALERIPEFFRAYHTSGEVRVEPAGPAVAVVVVDLGTVESVGYAWMLAGFFQRMLELTGAREVGVELTSCRALGDDQTAISLRWG